MLRRILRLLTSVVGIGLLLAVPLALLQIWRGQLAEQSATDQGNALRRGELQPEMVVAALVLIVGLAWLRVFVGVVVELVSLARHRPVPEVRGLGSGQRIAALLVGGLTALTVSVPRPSALPAVKAHPVATYPLVASGPTQVNGSRPANGALADHVLWVVPHRDTLWNLSERVLGDGSRWREIVSANRGHEVAPGLPLDTQTRLVHAGWQLLLPADARVPSTAPVMPETVQVQPGDTLSGIAAAHLGDGGAWPEIWEMNRGRELDGRRFDDPNLIFPGWVLDLPIRSPGALSPDAQLSVEAAEVAGAVEAAEAAEAVDHALPAALPPQSAPESAPPPQSGPAPPTESAPSLESAAPSPTAAEPSVPDAAPVALVDEADTPPPTVVEPDRCEVAGSADPTPPDQQPAVPSSNEFPVPLPAALLVAAGAVGLIDARRRQRQRRASVGARFPEADPHVTRTEQRLRSLASEERLVRLDLALRAAAAMLAQPPAVHGPTSDAPALILNERPVVIHAALVSAQGGVELVLSGTAWPKEPFVVGADPHRWLLPAEIDLTALAPVARTSGAPCPALVQVGTAGGAEVFVDVEAWGTLGVDVAPERAAVVLRSMVADLAFSPFAQQVEVLVVGLEGVDGLPRVNMVDDAESALELAITATTSIRASTENGLTTLTLRARALGETWEPAFVVLADGTQPHIPPCQGLAALTVGRPDVGCFLTEQDGSWWLEPLHLPLVPAGAALDEIRAIRAVLDHASVEPDQVIDDAPQPPSVELVPPYVEAPWAMLVRLLGSPAVESAQGVTVAFDRSKALELVVWLSQHRRRATRTAARTALWELEVRDATFANVVSDARRAMARCAPPPEGDEWIGRTLTEDLPLHPLVITDAELVAGRVRHAAQQDHADAVRTLEPAVEMLRGLPLEGTAYGWADGEGLSSNLVMLAVSAASELARHHLALGDLAGVFSATARGLEVLPGHDELLALRLRAHARSGDVAGLRAEWAAYERALAADAWADDPSEKLVALRQELLAGLAAKGQRSS